MTLGIVSSSMFQGAGKGLPAFVITVLRAFILTPLLVLVFADLFDFGLVGFWWGIVVANTVGPIIAFSWARFYLGNLMKKGVKA